MEIRGRQLGKVIILELFGRIDVDSANLVEAIGQCVRDGYVDIICNLEEIEFIDYTGVSVVAVAYKEVINHQGRMKLCNMPTYLRQVFSVSGLDRVIEIYPDEELALNSFKEDKIIEDIKKMQLRRRFKRLPVDIHIELQRKSAADRVCLKAEILNLSAIGAFIFGCGPLELGSELLINFKLPPKMEDLQLEAKVVWLPDRQLQPHFHPGMGIEFLNITQDAQKKLLEFIDRNLSFMSSD